MRITPLILIGLGLWGLVVPETLLETDAATGRIIFCLILALGSFSLWRYH